MKSRTKGKLPRQAMGSVLYDSSLKTGQARALDGKLLARTVLERNFESSCGDLILYVVNDEAVVSYLLSVSC